MAKRGLTTPLNVAATVLGHGVSGFGKLAITSGSIWLLGNDIAGRVASDFALATTVGTAAAVGSAGALLHFEARIRGAGEIASAARLARYHWRRVLRMALVGAALVMVALFSLKQPGWITAPLLVLGHACYLFGKHVPFARRGVRGYVWTELLGLLGVGAALAMGWILQSGIVTLVVLACGFALAGVVGGQTMTRPDRGASPDRALARAMRSYALWVVLATAVAFGAANLPISLLAFRGGGDGLTDAARLAVLTALLAPAYLLPRAVGMNLLVDISEQAGNLDTESHALLAKVLAVLLALSMIAVILIAVFGDELAGLVAHSSEPQIGLAFRRLALGTILIVVTTPISNLLSGTGRVHLTAAASGAQAAVTLGGVMFAEPTLVTFAGWILLGSLVKALVSTVASLRIAVAPARDAAFAVLTVCIVGAALTVDTPGGTALVVGLGAMGCWIAGRRLLKSRGTTIDRRGRVS